MAESMSISRLLTLALGAMPLANAVGCPYVAGNPSNNAAAHYPRHPEAIIEPRLSTDKPEFGRCPRKSNLAGGGTRSKDWWPCELNLAVLRQNADKVNPHDEGFDYATEFAKLDGNYKILPLSKLQADDAISIYGVCMQFAYTNAICIFAYLSYQHINT